MLFADCRRSLAAGGVDRLDGLRDSHLLVTGGTGFVGLWLAVLVAYLNDHHGFRITLTGIARHRARLEEQAPFIAARADIRFVAADVRQFFEVARDVSWMIHAAANPDSRHHATNPIDTAAVIGEGTAHVLRMAEQAPGLRRFLHLSSGLVGNGEPSGRVGATSVYVAAKAYSEALCAAFRSQARMPIVVTRPFTFIGPLQRLDAPWAANNFLHAALNGQPLKILGSGEIVRAYLYGSDMAVLALLQLVAGESGETYDLGGGEAIPLRDLAELVVAQAGRPLEIRCNTAGREVAGVPLLPDAAKLARQFAFTPAFCAGDAIARTLAWHGAGEQARRRVG